MQLIGFKGCPYCGKKLGLSASIAQSFDNRHRMCGACGKNFNFESFRNKVAWVVLLLIVVVPSILILHKPEIFLDAPYLSYFPVKYLVSVIIFYLVTGNSKYLPNKVKNENAASGTDAQ